MQRTSMLRTLTVAPLNALQYTAIPAAWNNGAMNAGNSTVLSVSGFVDIQSGEVLEPPPLAPACGLPTDQGERMQARDGHGARSAGRPWIHGSPAAAAAGICMPPSRR
jgi:hypothetical protein